VGRATRPAASPKQKRAAPAASGARNLDLRKVAAQSAQNCLLVQKCQRARSILEPHSEQKLGLYMM